MYKGHFVDGKKSGQGLYHFKNESCQFVGTFSDGAFVVGRWIHKDGSTCTASFSPQVGGSAVYTPIGKATLTFKRAGLVQEGEFKDHSWCGGAIRAA